MRVVSFNIRYDEPADGDHIWGRRIPALAAVWEQFDADVIGIQEGLPHQVNTIHALFSQYDWFGRGGNPDSSGEHEAIFYRRDRFQCLESGHFWLSNTPFVPGGRCFDNPGIRMASWVRLWDTVTKTPWFILNTHFDVRSEFSRNESSKLIRKFLDQRVSVSEDPVIVMGDLNADPDSEALKTFIANGDFVDALKVAGDTRMTYHGFKGEGTHRIDYILCNRRIQVKLGHVITDSYGGLYPSDHYPILAEVELVTK